MHSNQEMTDFNYKKYSLENLENWLHDAMSAGEASPQEIYDTIKKVVEENYYYFKDGASRTYELLSLLNGQVVFNIDPGGNYVDNMDKIEEDKVVKWQLPVNVDGLTGDCYVNFPDDLLEAANLCEGDRVEWIDNQDGSYTLKKAENHT